MKGILIKYLTKTNKKTNKIICLLRDYGPIHVDHIEIIIHKLIGWLIFTNHPICFHILVDLFLLKCLFIFSYINLFQNYKRAVCMISMSTVTFSIFFQLQTHFIYLWCKKDCLWCGSYVIVCYVTYRSALAIFGFKHLKLMNQNLLFGFFVCPVAFIT